MKTRNQFMNVKLLIFIGWLFNITAIADEKLLSHHGDGVPGAKRVTYSKGAGSYVFLYPYGWSKDGKFAYVIEQRPGPLPICHTQYSVLIIDTQTNIKLWNHTLRKGDEFCSEPWIKQDAPASLKKVWAELKPIITPQFKKHAIIQMDQAIQGLPLPGIDQTLQLIITREYSNDQLLFFVKKINVELGERSILTISGEYPWLNIELHAYISSPFAKYFALIFDVYTLGQHYEKIGPYYVVAGINPSGINSLQPSIADKP